MSEVRIIKKYPNRRLYDTAISSYITLEDVRRLVLDDVPVKVTDARSQEEITHNTLLQIIVEQEEKGPHLFTTESLQEMIRLYGSSVHGVSTEVLEQSLNFFSKSLNLLKKVANTDEASLRDLLQKQSNEWQALQQRWLQTLKEPVAQAQTPAQPAYTLHEDTATT